MTEIKLDANKEVGWDVLPGELRALSCGDYDGRDMPLGLPTALRYLADAIEEQVKPAIEEPKEFGSVIQATNSVGERQRWLRGSDTLGHPWISESDSEFRHFEDLRDVEVLRVGVGEATYEQGWEACRSKLRTRFIQLASSAITSERKDAWRQALDALEALS